MTQHPSPWLRNNQDRYWQLYRKRLKQCQRCATEDAVHDLRTSTRRVLSLIELLQHIEHQASLQSLRKAFKTQLDDLDALRDTQVMRLEISGLIRELPALSDFLHHLHVEEQRLLMAIPACIKSLGKQKLRRRLQKAANRSQRNLTPENTVSRLITIIDSLYQSALERYRNSSPDDPASLHSLRIGMKKLRYSLELTQTMLPMLPEQLLPRIQAYLGCLGDIQNIIVLQGTLEGFYDTQYPAPLRDYFEKRRQSLINDYMTRRDAIHEFWREDSQQPFPWDIA